MTDIAAKRCSRCGAEYSNNSSPLGLCPGCLLTLGMSGIHDPGAGSQESAVIERQESTVITPPESPAVRHAHAPWPRWRTGAAVALLVAIGALLFFVAISRRNDAPPFPIVVRFTLPFPNETRALEGPQFAPSPDGTAIALAARGADGQSRLWVRRLRGLDWQELPRTDGAAYPFWSPDSQHVGFFADRRLQRINLASGLTQTVGDAPDGRGGTWGSGDDIVFAPGARGALMRVTAVGGTPQPITTLDRSRAEVAHLWPMFLEDGRRFVYFANTADRRNGGSYVGDVSNGSKALVVGRDVVTVPVGDLLLFSQDRTLITQRFDAARGELHDSAQAIAGAVDVGGPRMSGPSFAASTHVLVYRNSSPPISRLVWFDRRGEVSGEVSAPADYRTPALSPDGRRIAVARADDRTNGSNLWLLDVERNMSTRLTFGPHQDASPLWSPDGDRIVFASRRDGLVRLMTTSAAGGGVEEEIAASPQMVRLSDWSIDGRTLLYTTQDPKTGLDVWAIPLTGDRKPWALIQTPFNESDARLSPDGRWVAYVSNESGLDQVYVRSFPRPESKWQASVNGGTHPQWRRDGRELLFVAADGTLTSVGVDAGPTLRLGGAVQLTRLPSATEFATTPDGQRLLVQVPQDGANAAELDVVVNWRSELRK